MTFYAQTPLRRTRQQLGDLALVVWCLAWLAIARFIHGLVGDLAGPGRSLEGAGRDLTESMRDAGGAVSDVPIAGDALQAPFDLAAEVGTSLQRAGQAQQDAVGTLALWLALVLAAVPIGWALVRWLPGRLRWMREAGAVGRVIDDVDLLALRALSSRSLTELAALGPAPAAAWRAGDARVIEALARLELAALGLRPPTQAAERPTRVW